MTAATISAIMSGIETRLETITGLRASDTSPDAIEVPSGGGYAVVGLPEVVNFHRTMGNGRIEPEFSVTVFVSAAAPRRVGQLLLADYLNPAGATSIRAAIEGDKSLGGAVHDCVVMRARVIGVAKVGEIEYLAAEWTLQTIALGA
jgi:hypothetical protein